jgi:hypothetical protein
VFHSQFNSQSGFFQILFLIAGFVYEFLGYFLVAIDGVVAEL